MMPKPANDGLTSSQRYYRRHADKIRERSRLLMQKKRAENPEKYRQHNREWASRNREHAKSLWRKSYQNNRPSKLKAAKIKREHKREYYKTLAKEWRKNNPERYKLNIKRWREEHYDKVVAANHAYRSRSYGASGYASSEDIDKRMSLYGYSCVYCNGPFQSIDHAIPLSRGGTHWPANLYPACKSCNSRKRNRTYSEFKALLKQESTNSDMLK